MNNIEIKRRKDLRGADKQAKIFLYCYLRGEPLTCYQIAKGVKLDRQLVSYHLKKLVEQGLILRYEKQYMVNPVFLDEEAWDCYYNLMINFLKKIKDKILFPENCNKEEVVKNILEVFPALFIYEVREM